MAVDDERLTPAKRRGHIARAEREPARGLATERSHGERAETGACRADQQRAHACATRAAGEHLHGTPPDAPSGACYIRPSVVRIVARGLNPDVVGRDDAHLSGLVVGQRLGYLRMRVHHKRAVPRDRLANRATYEHAPTDGPPPALL